MSKRTVSEIRAYCEAASEGPWTAEIGAPYSGSLVRDKDIDFSIAQHIEAEDAQFIANARTDLPRLLDAAVKLRAALSYRITRAGTPEQLREAEDVLMANTAWLVDSPEAVLSPDGEKEGEG